MDRTKGNAPRVVPNLDPRIATAKISGVRTQKDQDIVAELNSRFTGDQASPIVTITTPFWFREGIGSGGDASYAMRMTLPTGSATFGSVASWDITMPTSGWVIGAFLELSKPITAGSVIGRIVIDQVTYSFEDNLTISLDSPSLSAASFFLPFAEEYPFAEDSVLRGNITTVGVAPTDGTARMWFVLRMDVI